MIDRDRAMHWLKTGAQPTDTVRNILSREGVLLAVQMEHKGATPAEIVEAMNAHVASVQSRAASKTTSKAAAAPAEEAAPEAEVAEAPAEEAPAAEAPAEETPVAEAPAEEAPAEEKAGE